MDLKCLVSSCLEKYPHTPAVFSPFRDCPNPSIGHAVPERKLLDLAYMIVTAVSDDETGHLMRLPLMGTVQKVERQQLPPGFATEEHSHDHIELVYVVQGSLHQRINGEDVHFREGDFCLIDSNVPHYEFLFSDNSIIAYLIFDESFFSKNLPLSSGEDSATTLRAMIDKGRRRYHYIRFTPKDGPETLSADTLGLILSELMNNLPNKERLVIDYIERLLVLLPREYNMHLAGIAPKEHKQALVGDLIAYIEKNLADITVQALASAYHYNPDYLNRVFRQFTGHPLSWQIHKMRMELALALLRETRLPVTAISHRTGYQNVSFFYRKFREFYRCSPDDMRSHAPAELYPCGSPHPVVQSE